MTPSDHPKPIRRSQSLVHSQRPDGYAQAHVAGAAEDLQRHSSMQMLKTGFKISPKLLPSSCRNGKTLESLEQGRNRSGNSSYFSFI